MANEKIVLSDEADKLVIVIIEEERRSDLNGINNLLRTLDKLGATTKAICALSLITAIMLIWTK
ncbi:hypothetical protein ACSV5M_19190 [Cellvibrio sp. ARAG 10.3]|uniref:hypothetical protein n=1 Tax=Cellvibrio sp. ARAG 10.3 TaxID=3451358 RepID=UPI003F44D363